LSLAALPLIGGCLRSVPTPPETAAATQISEPQTAPSPPEPAEAPAAKPVAQSDIETAAVTPIPAELVLPANVQPTGPMAELIRLAHTGAAESDLVAFVSKSPSTFNARADEIIYLNDIGIPGTVVTAMLQRDQQLKAIAASAAAAAPPGSGAVPAPAGLGPETAAPSPYAAAPAPIEGLTAAPEPAMALAAPGYEPDAAPPPEENAAYPEFYEALAPYGSWVDVAGYGSCWQPAVTGINPGWQPYLDGGCWAYTDCGWYWRSDYSWGWAPFHYGRWFHHRQWGWCWRPESAWAPSWVCWRHDASHCGWAPLPPSVRHPGRVGVSGHVWQVTRIPSDHFRFVDWGHFRGSHLERHSLTREQSIPIYNHTVAVTRIVPSGGRLSNEGLAPERVAAATHTTLTRVALRDIQPTTGINSRPDRLETSGRTLAVYRPHVATVPREQFTAPRQAPALSTAVPAAVAGRRTAPSPSQPRVLGQSAPHAPIILRGPDHPAPVSASTPAAPGSATRTGGARTPFGQSHWSAARQSEWPARFEAQPTSSRPQRPNASPAPDSRSSARASDYPFASQNRASTGYLPLPADRWQHGSHPSYQAPDRAASAEVPRYSAPAGERSHHESAASHEPQRPSWAAAERPSRAEPSESHVSHSAPAPAPAPAAPSHSQSSSEHSSSADRSSRSGR
jgi:hypothetical protein